MFTGSFGRLTERVDLSLPEFAGTVPPGVVFQYHFAKSDAGQWLNRFSDRLSSARGFLPLYRMSDGEFLFVCGRLPPPISFFWHYPNIAVRGWARAMLKDFGGTFLSGSKGYGFEAYTPEEWSRARDGYGARVRAIANAGIIAANFVRHCEFSRQYIRPMCDWMDSENIALTETNYFPFYFVYALLLGQGARKLLTGRRVLVVTSDEDGSKAPAIDATLRRFGADSSVFRPISRSKSMFDRLDLKDIGQIDLVLIGAGVGALNILEQVAPLGALSMDVGFVLDCYWRPSQFIGRRAFTAPDQALPELAEDKAA